MSTGSPVPGRRIAAANRRSVDRTAVLAAVLLVLAAGAVLVGGRSMEPADRVPTATAVPVDHVVRACSRSGSLDVEESEILLGSVPLGGLGNGGRLAVGSPGSPEAVSGEGLARGELVSRRLAGTGTTATAIEADGERAAGLLTSKTDRSETTLAVSECPAPRSRWWFTGAGATLDHSSELVLTNLDPGPAVVDVSVLGLDGEVDTLGTRGIVLAPGETTGIELVDIAPQSEELSLRVTTSRGRVAAAIADSLAADIGAVQGVEWIPAQADPSRVVRLAGLPPTADERTLLVTNPSSREALVEVEVAGESGSFAPTENARIRVPPGAVSATNLTASIGRDPSAVVLRSSVPVTATVRSIEAEDHSYAAAVSPLTGAAAAAVVDDAGTTVLLTADRLDATARLQAFDSQGNELDEVTLEMAPGATASWRPRPSADYVVVTPTSGSAFGGVTMVGSAGLTQLGLAPVPVELRQPLVVPVLR